MRTLTSAFVLLIGACGAPADDASSGAHPRVATAATPIAAPAAAPTASATGPWRARVAAELAALRRDAPALHAELATLQPARTRAGLLRFTTSSIHDPRVAAVFLDRIVNAREPEPVRAALVEALPRTGGLYADAAAELIASERSPLVRATYVHAARRAPADPALAIIERGLADADPVVTAEAARAAAAHPAGGRAAASLRAALGSADAMTRAAAARALGVLAVAGSEAALTARLADPAADVRLEALRALDRLAPGAVAGLDALARDPDPRVARLAARLAARAATATP